MKAAIFCRLELVVFLQPSLSVSVSLQYGPKYGRFFGVFVKQVLKILCVKYPLVEAPFTLEVLACLGSFCLLVWITVNKTFF